MFEEAMPEKAKKEIGAAKEEPAPVTEEEQEHSQEIPGSKTID